MPTPGTNKTFLAQMREAARDCSNIDYRATLKAAADTLDTALDAVWRHPTADTMTALNGAWANAHRIYKDRPPEGAPPKPLADAKEAGDVMLAEAA